MYADVLRKKNRDNYCSRLDRALKSVYLCLQSSIYMINEVNATCSVAPDQPVT